MVNFSIAIGIDVLRDVEKDLEDVDGFCYLASIPRSCKHHAIAKLGYKPLYRKFMDHVLGLSYFHPFIYYDSYDHRRAHILPLSCFNTSVSPGVRHWSVSCVDDFGNVTKHDYNSCDAYPVCYPDYDPSTIIGRTYYDTMLRCTRVGDLTIENLPEQFGINEKNLEVPDLNYYEVEAIKLHKSSIMITSSDQTCSLLSERERSRITHLDYHTHLRITSGDSTEMFCEFNDSLRQVRHNLVSGHLRGGTDMPLSSIIGSLEGIEKNLTPDYIDTSGNIVLEVGTTLKTTKSGLEDEALDKINKYKYILDRLPFYTLYVLIVGRNSIVTNLTLPQQVVDTLVSRFRMGRELEAMISDSLGRDIFHTHSSQDQQLAMSSLCQDFRVLDSEGFPSSMGNLVSEMSDHEKTHCVKLLSESMDRTGREEVISSSIDEYISKFKHSECRHEQKRVCNFPIVSSNNDSNIMTTLDPSAAPDMPIDLRAIWEQSKEVYQEKLSLSEQVCQSLGITSYEKHVVKKQTRFTAILNNDEKLLAAESGIMRKSLKYETQIQDKYATTKKSFHPNANTQDIEDFIQSQTWSKSPCQPTLDNQIMDLILNDKQKKQIEGDMGSMNVFKSILDTELIWLSSIITEIVLELSYTYKHYSTGYQFYHKISPRGIHLLIKPTKTHIYYSIGFPRSTFKMADPGRIGPSLYVSNNYIFSDWSSINEMGIDHFVKTGPYMASIHMFFSEQSGVNVGALSDHYRKTINAIFLLHLNNKLDAEELVTSQRFLWMRSMEEIKPNPDFFIERLPEVLRSRLTVYLVKKTFLSMTSLKNEPIVKAPKIIDDKTTSFDFLNVKSLFTGARITLAEKINEFYYGYVITKARGADSSFKIVKKILKEEYKACDLKAKAVTILTEPSLYESDSSFLKFIAQRMRQKLIDQLGENFESVILQDIIRDASTKSFEDISTLKASARDHSQNLIIDDSLLDSEAWMINAAIRKSNESESRKRPKVIVAMKELVEIFKKEKGRSPFHLVEMAPWCLNRLLDKGYIDSDIFSKPQHNGVREIHVLEIAARIVQYYSEMISYQLCSYFPSETTCTPETKSTFVRSHYQNSQKFKNPVTFCKSADATKWCQRHHVLTFVHIAAYTVPVPLQNFLLSTFSLWPHKRLNFPIELASNFIANRTVKSDPVYERLRHEFETGTGAICSRRGNKLKIQYGMWQGIWHRWSSFKQGANMEIHKDLVEAYLDNKGIKHKMSVIYGSDDSGVLLTLEGGYSRFNVTLAHRLLLWKEKFAEYSSINSSTAKTTISACEVFEYNSEWFVCGKPIKPTFRWVSAALAVTTTHRFIDRFRTMYNSIKDCIEGGCSTLTGAVIQLCQAWLHYVLMGFSTSDLRGLIAKLLKKVQDPSLGYFIFDEDYLSGIPGYEYNLYIHSKSSNYANYLPDLDEEDPQNMYTYDGQKIKTVARDLRGIKLRHGRLSLWESVRDKFDVQSADEAIQRFDMDPLLLFGRHVSWEDSYPHLVVKIFAPGVKESLSTYNSLARTATSSMYLFSRPCLTISGEEDKMSLLAAILRRMRSFKKTPDNVKRFFPYWRQYDTLHKETQPLKTSIQEATEMRPRGKVVLSVIEAEVYSMPVLEMCKRVWWGIGKVALSSKQIPRFWKMTKEDFPFLKDSAEETCSSLKLCMLELKNLLEGLSMKGRRITLFDTFGKSGSLPYTMSRIYWPGQKLQFSAVETSINTLKSELTSTCSFYTNRLDKNLEIRSRIANHPELDVPFSSIPDNAKPLKLMHDYLNGRSRQDILSVLSTMKQGSFGVFIQRQPFDHNRKTRNKYTGKGVWIGKVASIDCRIHLEDDSCKMIEIKQAVHVRELGKGLVDLMKSFKVLPSDTSSLDSKFKLTSSGFIRTRCPDDLSYPININPNILFDILSGVDEQIWSIEHSHNSVKLMAKARPDDLPYTLISQPLRYGDWEQGAGYFSNYSLSCWNKLEPLPISEFERVLRDIPSDEKFTNFWKRVKKGEILCEWDLLELSQHLRKLFGGQLNTSDIHDDDSGTSLDDEVILSTLRAINKYEPNINDLSWAEEMQQVEYSGLDFISTQNDEIINQTVELLQSFLISGQNLLYQDQNQLNVVHNRRRFYDHVITLAEVIGETDFQSVLKDRQKTVNSPILRKLFMIMDGKYDNIMGPKEEDELSGFISHTISTLEGESLDNMHQRLSEIEDSIPNLKGFVLQSMLRAKYRLESQIRTITGNDKYQRLDIDGDEFYKALVRRLIEIGERRYISRTQIPDIQVAILKTDIAIKIQDELSLENLTPQEAQEENLSLQRGIISLKILQIICSMFNINLIHDGQHMGNEGFSFVVTGLGELAEDTTRGF
jgi:hypothetical protein